MESTEVQEGGVLTFDPKITVCRADNQSPTTNTGTYSTSYQHFARAFFLTAPTPTPTPTPIVVTSERLVTSVRNASAAGLTPTPTPIIITSERVVISVRSEPSAVSNPSSSRFTPTSSTSSASAANLAESATASLVLSSLGISKGAIAGIAVELAATTAAQGTGYAAARNDEEKHRAVTSLRPAASSPPPPSDMTELSAANAPLNRTSSPYFWTSHPSSPAVQHGELPSYAPGNQPFVNELGTAQPHPTYVENTGPYYPEAYAAPQDMRTSQLAELESQQRELEERMARMRHLSALEEGHARMQSEIARLRQG
ncbi:hypothetical protein EK21DRAFT_114857 [Setomelanomma holmii]|uniref:Uncharacterized protein n=1 Tax=Setomelanomma holmii TaxID=210430 RepID=A0A9P4LHY4_9PLEO|nr:hypothetical protein EK21DRAFT_114857 [Setomelanomma holmii]